MKNAMKLILITALAISLGATLVAFSNVPAQAMRADTVPEDHGSRPGGADGRVGRTCPDGTQAAADMLGMTVEDLNAQRWAGMSLEELAEANNVDYETLQEAMQAACEASLAERPEPAYSFEHMRYSEAGFEVLAEALGMSVEDLNTALDEGQTLAELAEAVDVDLQDLMNRYQEANQEAMKDSILQAIEDGDLDQDHGNWLLEGLAKGFMGGQRGIGRMGKMGRGMGW